MPSKGNPWSGGHKGEVPVEDMKPPTPGPGPGARQPRTHHRFTAIDTVARYIQHALPRTGTTITVDFTDDWPNEGNWYAVIEPDTHREEVVKVIKRMGNTLVVERGFFSEVHPHPVASGIQQVLHREFVERWDPMQAYAQAQEVDPWPGEGYEGTSLMDIQRWRNNWGPNWDYWAGAQGPLSEGSPLKFMPPGSFCPDVLGLEDLGEADYLRGKVVRAFFRLMRFWPHPTAKSRRLRR